MQMMLTHPLLLNPIHRPNVKHFSQSENPRYSDRSLFSLHIKIVDSTMLNIYEFTDGFLKSLIATHIIIVSSA